MNTGQSLDFVMTELERQATTRRDFLAPVGKLTFDYADERLLIGGLPGGQFPATEWAEGQVRDHFKIPAAYYGRMRESAPDLIGLNLNRWAREEPGAKRMVRTLDGNARAFVSDAYRCLNNTDFAMATLPVLREKRADIVSAAVTDTRLYIKAKCPWLEGEVKGKHKGDVVQGGLMLRNSEVGNGALDVSLYITRLICDNGAVSDSILRRAHLGKRQGGDFNEAVEFFSDKTRRLDDAAFFSKVKDMILRGMAQEFFDTYLAKANGAASDKISKDAELDEVVEVTLSRFGVPLQFSKPVLHNLIDGGDLSRWGLHNAVTSVANDLSDYEASTVLESVGGKIIDLTAAEWHQIAA